VHSVRPERQLDYPFLGAFASRGECGMRCFQTRGSIRINIRPNNSTPHSWLNCNVQILKIDSAALFWLQIIERYKDATKTMFCERRAVGKIVLFMLGYAIDVATNIDLLRMVSRNTGKHCAPGDYRQYATVLMISVKYNCMRSPETAAICGASIIN
jgi:hypothetical protein